MSESSPQEAAAARPVVFETARMVARPWSRDDVDGALEMYGDPEVVRYIGGELETDRSAMASKIAFLIERVHTLPAGHGSFPMFRRSDGRLIGTALLKPLPDVEKKASEDVEIGWHLARAVWGQGYATEMGHALLEQGFRRLGIDVLHAVVEPPNDKSQAVARRLGMRHVGRTNAYCGGIELEHFVLRSDEWSAAGDGT